MGSIAKSELYFEGQTLLHRTLSAVEGAPHTGVVGSRPSESLADGVLLPREDPSFGGPAAGIAAGMACLSLQPGGPSDAVLVIACDMPHVDRAVTLLIARLGEHPDADGVVPVDSEDIVSRWPPPIGPLALSPRSPTRSAPDPSAVCRSHVSSGA
jgi:molybdopterin-guanine dinucleotide biosynthesis protein A